MKITNMRTVLMMTTSMYNSENVWELFLKLNGLNTIFKIEKRIPDLLC